METNNKISEPELNSKGELENLKKDLIKENAIRKEEEIARKKLEILGYGFIKKAEGVYLLSKEGSFDRPNMGSFSETLYVEINDIRNLVKLAEFIEKKLQEIKGNLNPYLDSDSLTKGLYYGNSQAPKDIYNKEKILGVDIINPDSKIISYGEIASFLGISEDNQEKNKEYINDVAEKIMKFVVKIKVGEK